MAADEPTDEGSPGRATSTEALWADVRIDPVEIALPGGVGYTLRAYRPAAELTKATEDADEERELDDFDAAAAAVARRRRPQHDDESDDESDEDGDEPEKADLELDAGKSDDDDDDDDDADDDDESDDSDEDEDDESEEADEEEAEAPQDVPVFLGRKGKVFLFHNPEKLVEFVRSAAEHDMSQLDSWADLVERVSTDDVVALDEDSYELDLVVENLRGGSDAWDAKLLLKAGEIARDLGYALRMDTVLTALGSGSPLDDLDEALRAADAGGIGSFFAKRKLRKVPAQQSSLAWRTVIGKISAVADWRD